MDEDSHSNSSSDFYGSSPPQTRPPPNRSDNTPAKRKLSDASNDHGADKKRSRASQPQHATPPAHLLPPEIWQYIFLWLSPTSLARVLRVDRAFNDYMSFTPQDAAHTACDGVLQTLSSDEIWKSARIARFPTSPDALPGCAELDFWKLVGARNCQFCGRQPGDANEESGPWSNGPGDQGVGIIWPFTIRSCGACLKDRVQTESSLMFSDFSAVLQTAPFTFLTNTNHVVCSSTLRKTPSVPPHVELTKVYYIAGLQKLQAQIKEAQLVGSDVAAKLFEDLKNARRSVMDVAEQWSAWQQDSNGLANLDPLAEPEKDDLVSESRLTGLQSPHSDLLSSLPDTSEKSPGTRQGSGEPAAQRPSTLRSAHDVETARSDRRTEIEKRCLELDPPISPEVLHHMDSFRAAMQIPRPLDEQAWNVLRPRLESQRDLAQQREHERLAVSKAMGSRDTPAASKDEMERLKERWEVAQKPIRARLTTYFDEIVRTSWADGRAVNADTSPRFAADSLVYVRNRYESDMSTGSKLVLEHMKWIYDHKIKPLTEHLRRDLFLCAECADKSKYWQFDSLIQHYAAKHTNTFSAGNTTVAWQEAIWPVNPPFFVFPDPGSKRKGAQTPFTSHSRSQSQTQTSPSHQPFPQRPFAISVPYSGYYSSTTTSPDPYGPPNGYFGSPEHYGHGGYPHPGQHPGHLASPLSVSPGFQGPAMFGAPKYPTYIGPTSPFDGRNPYIGPSQTPIPLPPGWNAPPFPSSSSHHPPFTSSPHQAAPSFLQIQSDALASIGREIWDALFNVKQIPPYVRMYVIIHHVVSRFKARFPNEPNLDLFTQCLVNHPLLRPLKDVNGLACKTCVLNNESHEESHSHAFSLTSGERKLYPFHSLLLHFKNVHIEHALALENAQTHEEPENLHRLDWKEDMIELPEDHSLVAKLQNAPGMDASKFQLIVQVFPQLSDMDLDPSRPASISHGHGQHGVSMHTPSSRQSQENLDLASQGFIKFGSDASSPGSPVTGYPASYPPGSATSKDDEYDPTRPAFVDSRAPSMSKSQRRKHNKQRNTDRRGQSYHGGYQGYSNRHQPYPIPNRYDGPSEDYMSGLSSGASSVPALLDPSRAPSGTDPRPLAEAETFLSNFAPSTVQARVHSTGSNGLPASTAAYPGPEPGDPNAQQQQPYYQDPRMLEALQTYGLGAAQGQQPGSAHGEQYSDDAEGPVVYVRRKDAERYGY